MTLPLNPEFPPAHAQVLVVGGGPAGSYAASALAREGLQVVLFESEKFPRYHIGESLIPSCRPYLRFIDAEEKIKNHGFFYKPGAAIKFNQFKIEGYTDFIALGAANNSWNVVRADFDDILLNHSRDQGAAVYEETRVDSFEIDDSGCPVSASWSSARKQDSRISLSKQGGKIFFDFLVDATGRNGLMSTKYLRNRRFTESLKNVAVWGYWKGCGCYGAGTTREGAPFFEALTDETGWAWFIPLSGGITSVGVVVNQEQYNKKETAGSPFSPDAAFNPTNSTMVSRYLSNLSLAPSLVHLVGSKATMQQGSVKSASDFSYYAPQYGGRNYRIVGDAGAFIDPFFSSGIHLACTSALSAAASICAVLRGDCDADRAAKWHTTRFATSYSRFQLVVLSAYKQIRNQSGNILADIDEDNFDKAFAIFRPIIWGASEMGALSENELQTALDFCVNIFNPTTPEQHDKLIHLGEVNKELMDINAPMLGVHSIKERLSRRSSEKYPGGHVMQDEEDEGEMVLKKVNARKVVHMEYSIDNLEKEALDGMAIRLTKGNLGLKGV